MAERPVDAFLLYNERETVVETIAERLQKLGVTTHFWRRDVGYGEQLEARDRAQLTSARVVVVLLGKNGWGPNHLKLTADAQELNKRIIPVLVGDPPPTAFAEAGALFRHYRYADLRKLDDASLQSLATSILSQAANAPGRFDSIVRVLTDGSDEARAEVLDRVIGSDTIDRAGLASRLRSEIQDRYNPGSEARFAVAVRDPKKISSVRSWMLSALIWSDAEEIASRDLILQHLQSSYEPERSVRFWVLAGVYDRNTSYLADAIESSLQDPEVEVAGLARAISRPHDDRVITDLRTMLRAEQFTTAWAALRILRVVPLTALAPDVCALLGTVLSNTRITYDALYALSNPPMAAAAAPILAGSIGIAGVVTRVIAEGRVAGGNTIRDFARLLAAFEPAEMDRVLLEAATDPETRDTVQALRRALTQRRKPQAGTEFYVSGYNSDTIDVAHECLGIDQDVQTLTAVMLAGDVKPPLAIGLFGDWGSGKSYFMKSMKVAADRLALRAKSSGSLQFCHDIVQIEFNAWHYADTNLWANLVSTILERLATYVTPRPTPEEEHAALLKELGTAKTSIDEANAVKAETQNSIAEHQAKLVEIQRDRQQKEVKLHDLRLPDLKNLLANNPDLKKDLDEALNGAGVPALLSSAADLSHTVTEAYSLRGRSTALFVALTTRKSGLLLLILTAVIIAIPIGFTYFVAPLDSLIARVSTIVSEVAVTIGGLAALVGTATRHVSKSLKRIEDVKASVDAMIADKRAQQRPEEIALQGEILELKAQEQEATARVVAASSRVTQLEERIRAMKEARTLARFLDERTSSDDYRKYLGLISTVRRDFEALSKRLHDARTDGTDVQSVDRIVLYIDDLDRCPADKVMEVLQAVHLLLAYELFVVVVGVDPRWLLHSLESTFTAFQQTGNSSAVSPELWVTTPRDYLEKIFQIPFAVLPMSESGYATLMSNLLSSHDARPSAPTPPGPDTAHAADGSSTQPDTKVPTDMDPDQQLVSVTPVQVDVTEEFVIHEEALTVKAWEETFARRLFPLIPTPRAAKRFSNVYRILKAPVRREDLANFEGTAELPGEFRVAMLLLAILIGAPSEAAELFPQLYQHAVSGGDTTDALRRMTTLSPQSPRFEALQSKVAPILDEGFASAETFIVWLPRVSRFSFDVGRGISQNAGVQSPAL